MSLFGTSAPGDAALANAQSPLFDEDVAKTPPVATKPPSDSLFADDDFSTAGPPPWNMPTPRADMLRKLLSTAKVPDSYVDAFEKLVNEDGIGGRVSAAGIARILNAAGLPGNDKARVLGLVTPVGASTLGRGEFNILLALIALAQQGEHVSLDSVDGHRRNLPEPHLVNLSYPENTASATFSIPARVDLAAKAPQRPITPPKSHRSPSPSATTANRHSMEFAATDPDPWNTPDLHQGHNYPHQQPESQLRGRRRTSSSITSPGRNKTKGITVVAAAAATPITTSGTSNSDAPYLQDSLMASSLQPAARTTSEFTTASGLTSATTGPGGVSGRQGGNMVSGGGGNITGGGWGGYYESGFGDGAVNPNPFGGPGAGGGDRDRDGEPGGSAPGPSTTRTLGSGRTGVAVEENIIVTLMPEKEGMFLFQHHNYEVTSARRGSKVIRRYSDFVWLLDCLHKRYPFRALPLLPPKRVAVNGNHLSNDGAFIEKRRRGLARFLNALVRHPVLSQEQLVIMFLTVPTELAVWRKQTKIAVQEEFQGRELPPGLEESLPKSIEELFGRTRMGIRRSAELYIGVCNIMDRLVKRSEGVAADHGRIALSLVSLTELSNETYATDTNDVPLLNDGLVSMAKHLRTAQSLMEDESKAWEQGVLEDLKRQRDALVSLRDIFDRRERYDKDTVPSLERRISKNEAKLAELRSRPEGTLKPGEMEKVAQAIVADRQSIIDQQNRSILVKECIRDELVYFQNTQYHVSRWNQDWGQERVKYAEMMADNWRRLLDQLEGMPLGN